MGQKYQIQRPTCEMIERVERPLKDQCGVPRHYLAVRKLQDE